ncbi:MAG: FKBP-type peptidyl-prolyl cis-trans isomerase [Lachnospiraceae bacterium]|nr:FKBP-type peptidyl-prolyl cis-trans isomerase [Lachnospiraceae bacterium]
MRKLFFCATFLAALSIGISSCTDSTDVWEQYQEWRTINDDFYNEQLARTNPDGTKYYSLLQPAWYPQSGVLIHYFNDRAETEGNLSPMYTSTVDTRYHLAYCEGTPIDSSTNITTYGPGIFRTQLSAVIPGWVIAMEDMRVGDTAEVLIPYQQGYGTNTASGILPYSALKFNIRLVDIVDYEKNPK